MKYTTLSDVMMTALVTEETKWKKKERRKG